MLRALTVTLAAATALALATPAKAQEKVVLGFPGTAVNVQYSYLAFGEELGFFKEENLKPEYISVSGSAVLLPQVANGQVHFGMANPDLMVIALSKNEPLPLRFVTNWLRSQTFEFVVPEASPVKVLAELKGKKIGVGALTWGNLPLSRAMLASVGLTWNKDVEVLPVGVGAAAWRRLQTGELDALNLYVGEHSRMELAGIPIRRLPMPDQFRTIFSNGLVTSNALIEKNPKLVAGFGRAMVKSWIACRENTEACVKAHWKANATGRPQPGKEGEQLATDMKQAMFDQKQIDDFSMGGDKYGFYPEDAWQRLVAIMQGEGQIARTDLDLSKLYTNQFVDEFNKFDKAALIATAKAAK